MLRVTKHYEENANIRGYEFVKIGITLQSDKEIHNTEELEAHSAKLLELSKNLVRKELETIKEERTNKEE